MKTLKIALMGYGKMGREIDSLARNIGHQVTCRITSMNLAEMKSEAFRSSDVIIEFSRPETVIANIKKCFELDLPVVVGTTGWYDQLEEVTALCRKMNRSLIYASNFSIGVNILFELNKKLASLMIGRPEYELSITEVHHLAKIDKPSGTAITLAKDILSILSRKKKWVLDQGSSANDEINIAAVRKEAMIGKHTVKYQSAIDELIIQHNAFSRKGFAQGALMAAEFIRNKKGVYTMADLLKVE